MPAGSLRGRGERVACLALVLLGSSVRRLRDGLAGVAELWLVVRPAGAGATTAALGVGVEAELELPPMTT